MPDDLMRKLSPEHLRCSGRMTAILACLLGERWTDPVIEHLHITSDGCVLARIGGDCGANGFIGDVANLARNIGGAADAAGLTRDERIRLAVLGSRCIHAHRGFDLLDILGVRG